MSKRRKRRSKRKPNKLVIIIALAVFVLLLDILVFKLTETGTFTVYDYKTNEEFKSYHHFIFAKNLMNKQDSDTVCIKNEKGDIVALKYGIVNFKTKDVTENTDYTTEDGQEGYLNGNYGVDAVYIQTSNSGKKIEFMMSGVKAWVSIDDVTLYTLDSGVTTSYYSKYDNSLVHTICADLEEGSSNSLSIGFAPDFMQDDTVYYSYDGNYFYTDYKKLCKDIKNDSHKNAVNDEAYYNFYQYVPHRSYSSITMDIMNQYLSDLRGITDVAYYYPCESNQSVLYNLGEHFITIQNQNGVNATMMFALALNESDFGQSQYAIENHNIFGHAVYDEDPDSANGYKTLEDCIYQHAYYFIQQDYANPDSEKYNGSWFGNKASGMNVKYASDPYWGEKAAYFYYQLDSRMGFADYNSNTLKTFVAQDDITVYGSSNGKKKLYTYSKGDVVSILIKEEKEVSGKTWYVIASEVPVESAKANLEKDYTEKCNGYILKKDIE